MFCMILVSNNIINRFHDSISKLSEEQPTTIFGKIWRSCFSCFFKSDQQIADTFNELADEARRIVPFLSKGIFSTEEIDRFNQDMTKLFKEIFPHMEINPFSQKKMAREIEEYFSEEIKRLRAEKPYHKGDEAHKTARKIAKAKLAISLGRGIEKNKGCSGSLIIQDINQKSIGVFKVSKKHLSIIDRIVHFFRSFAGQVGCLSDRDLAQPQAEVAAYLFSKNLDFHLAPASQLIQLNNLEGVFQLYIREEKNGKRSLEYQQAQEGIEQINNSISFSKEELILFQKFAIFDYLIGNLDRHDENWLIAWENHIIKHIKAIDNANAFPKVQPDKNTVAARNQYLWKNLKIANEYFREETVQFVKDNLTPEKILAIISELNKVLPGFLEMEMERLLFRRAEDIWRMVQTNHTPAQLAEV
jgi:Phosphatidylinositol 3- and 4-kinase